MTVPQFLLMVYMIGLAAGLPVDQRGSDDANEEYTSPRFSSGAGSPRTTTKPQQYILDLYESVYENRIPTDEATDVWVFVDKGELAIPYYTRISISINYWLYFHLTDVARESFREKPFVNTKCVSYTQYIFQGSSEIQSLHIRSWNSTLHAYIKTINRHFRSDEPVSVTLTVTMIPYNENGTSNTSDLGDGVIARQKVVTVSRGSDRWMELNVTKGVEGILPQMQIKNCTDIQVIIKAEVDCNNQKKVPFNLINPAEIPLDQVKRRERQMDNQPFLVVFSDNEETKEALLKEKEEEEIDPGVDNGNELVYDGQIVSNRSTSSCQKSDFILDFHELGLSNYTLDFYDIGGLSTVILPRSINIFKCSGTCNDRRVYNGSDAVHAKMMAAFYNQQTLSGEPVTATFPCCVPTKYRPVSLLHRVASDAFVVKLYPYLMAKECGCR